MEDCFPQYSPKWSSFFHFIKAAHSPHPSRHPGLPERQPAVVGRHLPRFEQSHATRFEVPAQG
jgi:hypothetical protein